MSFARLLKTHAVTILAAVLSTSFALAGTEKVLHTFNAALNGGNPQSSLIADAQGNLYGTASTGGTYGGGIVFKLTPSANGAWKATILHSFQGFKDGYYPQSGLVFDKAGNLYGTTASTQAISCGPYCLGGGTVFELSPNSDGSWTEKVIHTFPSQGGSDGSLPQGNLIFDSAGNLYGTTEYGGRVRECNCGTVFELSPTPQGSWTQTILYSFTGMPGESGPVAGVIFDSAGNLYGTTYGVGGGSCSRVCGTAFQLSPSSTGVWTETILHQFTGYGDGGNPSGGLIFDNAGNLYGNNSGGLGSGVVFELSPVSGGSWVEKTISVNVYNPVGSLVFDSFGNLYGVSAEIPCCGFIFKLSPTSSGIWQTSWIHTFQGNNLDGIQPEAGLIVDAAGNLYGTTIAGGGYNCYQAYFGGYFNNPGCGTVFKMSLSSTGDWTETQLYNFPGSDGLYPAGITSDGSGNFYGVTVEGGAYGYGEIFKMSPSGGRWNTSILYSFSGFSDGGFPNPVTLGADGNLYGATNGGGLAGPGGCGVVFQLSPAAAGAWKETVLHTFRGTRNKDGCSPQPFSLLLDRSGNIYGGTQYGGSYCPTNSAYGCGTIFEVSPAGNGTWTETVLHRFYAIAEGVGVEGLALDAAGNLFGVSSGGSCNNYYQCGGLAFEMSPNGNGGWAYKVIYDFPTTGPFPISMIIGPTGNLYGTTNQGYSGGIYELSSTAGVWNLDTLYSFTNSSVLPLVPLTLDASGNLYGATYGGTVFELSPSGGMWNLNTLYTFTDSKNGLSPSTNLVLDSAGNLYGATFFGGTGTGGVIFEVSP
jgi:uncharacterized repeat protein (TIGR03803 family)